MGAILTGSFNLLAEQHGMTSFRHVFLIIHDVDTDCYCYFSKYGEKQL